VAAAAGAAAAAGVAVAVGGQGSPETFPSRSPPLKGSIMSFVRAYEKERARMRSVLGCRERGGGGEGGKGLRERSGRG